MTDPSASVRNAVVPFNPQRDWSGANGTSGLVRVLLGIHRWLGGSFPQTQVASRIRLVSLMVAAEIWLCFWFHSRGSAGEPDSPRDTGYRGVWYANQPSGDEYRYKYSGGFATYPHQTLP